ncbi:concanavalin A-like lectin/glucanase [Meira miltonrushii]|uniref:Concanavalin A-like lectin/glucanase n=1 Tax=Meira miltonrushii TaxID=1280837 RepID=A0A316V551_9BASI|nr:concanavalin A-like lectin/glucanase [Meira miltonrushii]PWN32148.1 concanavalin A-like lectin/glucanase [Meira miltonrushii]
MDPYSSPFPKCPWQQGQYQQISPSQSNVSGTLSGSTAFSSYNSSKKRALSNKPNAIFMGNDDDLHNPGPKNGARADDDSGSIFTLRGLMNIGTLVTVASSLLMLFAGYPILVFVIGHGEGNKGGYNLGGTNATGQVPFLVDMPSLIDKDTPQEAYTRLSLDGKKTMKLVFSDEFNKDGRSFYPGDDPFWEAVDLHYWGTGNYEWYDPAAVTTENGNLVISLSEAPEHNLNFRGGMLTSWNKLCFTGGYVEVSVVLPGSPDISGLWPAAWTMGNLGRAGYGATTDGMWPYSYDTCDVGTLSNQTWPASMGGGPVAAETTGVYVDQYGPGLSYLPGQRLSRCTCPDFDDHPGPKHSDGSWVGRSAPEIDIIEAQASGTRGLPGHVSMSMQLAPFDAGYNMSTKADAYTFYEPEAILNSYTGSVYQQAASGLITTDRDNYEDNGMKYASYGFEYKPGGTPDAYVTWTKDSQPMWKMSTEAIGPNVQTEIGQRTVPPEPLYIILNLGMSSSFTYVDFDRLHFPAKYYVDYVRIWQPEDEENIGCDPPDFPTFDYINKHWEAYNNPNLTIWHGERSVGAYDQPRPPNRLVDKC